MKAIMSRRVLILIALATGLVGACSAGGSATDADSGAPDTPRAASGDATDTDSGAPDTPRAVSGDATDADSGAPDTQCLLSCALGYLSLLIPADRLSDVASIMGTGTCDQGFSELSAAAGFPPGHYITVVHGAGTCRVTVAFLSGAPDFVSDVQTEFGVGPCCSAEAYAQPSFISIPEIGAVDAGNDIDAHDDTPG